MKRSSYFFLLGILLSLAAVAQTDKAKLSQEIMARYQENLKQLQQLTWQRKMEGKVDGNTVMSSVASMSIGSDYKLQAVVTSQQSYVEKKRGIRGRVQASVVSDVNEYVNKAIQISADYIVLTQGQMLDLFTKGTLSETENSRIGIKGADILNKGDKLDYKFDKASLLYHSQDFTFLMGEDPVNGKVQYETLNGISRIINVILDVTKVKFTVKLTNFNYAKKM